MRKISALFVLFLLIVSSCATVPPGQAKKAVNPPPGQMKKVTGSKSAAPYAPGQQNKPAGKKKN
jgi:hypothetical protein